MAEVFRTNPGGALSIPWHVRGKLFIECSTIDIETSRAVAEAVNELGGTFVDAPVSGGPAGAQAGSLTFMMGVTEGHPRKAEMDAVVRLMGKNLFACGGPTLGLVTKVCNNYISGTIAIATSEGFNLAMKLGLDPRTFHKVLNVSTGGSWVNTSCNVSGRSAHDRREDEGGVDPADISPSPASTQRHQHPTATLQASKSNSCARTTIWQ